MIAETWNDIPNHALVQTTVKTNHGLYIAYKGGNGAGKWLYTPTRGWDIERENGQIYTWWQWRDAGAPRDYVVIGHVAPTASDEEIKAACQAGPPVSPHIRVGDEVLWQDVPDGAMAADSDGCIALRRGDRGKWWKHCGGWGGTKRSWSWGDKRIAEYRSDTGRIVALAVTVGTEDGDDGATRLQAIAEAAVVGMRIGDTVAWDAVQDGTLVADSDGYLAIRRGNDGQWVFNPYQKLWRDGRHFVWGDKAGAMRKSDTGRVLAVGLQIKDVTHTELVKLAIKQNPGLPPLA